MKIGTVWLLVLTFFRAWSPFSHLFRFMETPKKRTAVRKLLSAVAKVLLTGCLILALLSLLGILGMLYYSFQMIGEEYAGRPDMGIFLGLCVSAVFLFISSVLAADSILYKARDLNLLLPLPITGKEFFFSRFLIFFFSIGGIYALVLLPAFIVALLTGKASVNLFAGFFLALVAGPVVPLLLGAIISWIVQRSGRKWASYAAKAVCTIGLAVAYLVIIRFSMSAETGELGTALQNQIGLITALPGKIPVVEVMSASFFPAGGVIPGWQAFGLTLSANGILLFLGVLALGKTYMRAILTLPRTAGKKTPVRMVRDTDVRRYDTTPATLMRRALLKREFAGLFSTSQIAFEIVGELLIPVILITVYMVMGMMDEISGMVGSIASYEWFPYAVFAGLSLMSLFTMVSSTSVSREGKYFQLSVSWPVASHELVRAKLMVHMLLVEGTALIYLILAAVLFGYSPQAFFWMVPLSFLINMTGGAVGLAVDYRNPKTDWQIPTQAVKQNTNGLIAMVVNLLLLGVIVLCVILPVCLGIGMEVSVWFGVLCALICAVFSIRLALRTAAHALSPR